MSQMELIEAVKSGNTESVKELIESGADVNKQDKQGWTPLNWAAGAGNLEMVELLLENGADPLAVGRDLRTPLREAEGQASCAVSRWSQPLIRPPSAGGSPAPPS